jgi:hypothetical protein
MSAWKYQIYFSLEINLVFPRTHVLFSISLIRERGTYN